MADRCRIAIVTGAHLCRNPRVVKEATALAGAGHEVVVLHQIHDDALAQEDEILAAKGGFDRQVVIDTRPHASAHRSAWFRLQRRIAVECVRILRWDLPDSLGYGVRSSLAAAKKLKADLTIGHQEVGLWVVSQLLGHGYRVGFDMEDWHSRDQLLEGRRRPFRLLRRAEAMVLRRASHLSTTSKALAEALALAYSVAEPIVVYNTFPWSDRDHLDGQLHDRVGTAQPSLHWVSQTIGPGRGLEQLCRALELVPTVLDVHLRGMASPTSEQWLREMFPSGVHNLYLHPLVRSDELLSRISEHDIGLALEWAKEPSRDLTVTNKILHYLLGGLAVVATDTQGQQEVAERAPESIQLCRAGDPRDLARAINELVRDPARLRRAKSAALRSAQSRFSWEHDAGVLLASVDASLRDERVSS